LYSGTKYFPHNYCGFSPYVKDVHYFTYTEQTAPDNIEVRGPLQNCASSAWNLLHFTLLAPGIWRWPLDFWKICGPLSYSTH